MKRTLTILPLAALSLTVVPNVTQAAEIYVYSPPPFSIMNNPACIAEGDFISCSTAFLNYENNIGAPHYATVAPNGFAVKSDQGSLKTMVVIGTGSGGQIPNNADFSTQIDRGYNTPNNGNFWTGTAPDPVNGPTVGDSPVAWDISLGALKDALTVNGVRKDLLVGYDLNETGNTVGQGLQIWAMATLRDVNGNLPSISFELNGSRLNQGHYDPASSVFGFQTGYSFDGTTPTVVTNPLDYTYIAGDVCVRPDGSFYTLIQTGQSSCASGDTHLSTDLGTSTGEWIAYIPELNLGLEDYMSRGYDVLSVQVKLGCFGNTTWCNSGGSDDFFIMAGDVRTPVPEPDSLSLLGLALVSLGLARRRVGRLAYVTRGR